MCVCLCAFFCECACYYVELCLILLRVMFGSYRYGGQSTPKHDYLVLQKSWCPEGRGKQCGQAETLMQLVVRKDIPVLYLKIYK